VPADSNETDRLPSLVSVPLRAAETGGQLRYDKTIRTHVREDNNLFFIALGSFLVFDFFNPSVFAGYATRADAQDAVRLAKAAAGEIPVAVASADGEALVVTVAPAADPEPITQDLSALVEANLDLSSDVPIVSVVLDTVSETPVPEASPDEVVDPPIVLPVEEIGHVAGVDIVSEPELIPVVRVTLDDVEDEEDEDADEFDGLSDTDTLNL
jgi:hypothetical protein